MNVENWSEELTKNWKQAQQQFWENVASQYTASGTNPATDFPNMTEGLNQWWALMNPSMSNQTDAAMKQAMDMGKTFTQFAEGFSKANTKGNTQSVESWLNAMEQSFKYRQSMNAYLTALSTQGLESVTAMRERMAGMEQAGERIKSLRELYELWIDVNEAIYSQFSMSQKFQDIYGDLVNACVAFQGQTASAAKPDAKPTASKAAAKPKAKKAPKPAAVKPDDLTKIKGIGPKFQKSLVALGIQSFKQLAGLSEQQMQELDDKLELKGRALRDNWIGQAAELGGKQ